MFDSHLPSTRRGKKSARGLPKRFPTSRSGIVLAQDGLRIVASTGAEDAVPRVPPRPGTQGAPGPGEQTAANAPSGADQLVLVIDDDTAIRRVIERVLLQNGFRVVTAQDGVDAVARLISLGAEIRLVITDLLMPRLDGCAVAQAIRKSYPQTRIVGMSGHAPEEVAERPSSAGFDVFLRKPFSYDELLAAVRAALAPDLRASPPPQSSGDAESGGDPAV